MTRRFDIGPIVLGLGSILVLVALFLSWYGELSAWDTFELADILLAALAVAGIASAVGLLTPDADYLDRRAVPWVVVAASEGAEAAFAINADLLKEDLK